MENINPFNREVFERLILAVINEIVEPKIQNIEERISQLEDGYSDRYLDTKQAAELTSLSERKIRYLRNEGRITSYKIDGRVLFREKQLLEELELYIVPPFRNN